MSTRRRDAGMSRSDGRRVLVIGSCETGLIIARNLADSHAVTFLSDDPSFVDRAAAKALDAAHVDVTDGHAIGGLESDHDVVIVAMPQDSTVLLVSHLLRRQLPDTDIVAWIDDPENHDAFDGMAVKTVSPPTVLTRHIREQIGGES